MPTIEIDSPGRIVSVWICFRRRLLWLLFTSPPFSCLSCLFCSLLTSRLGSSSIGVSGSGEEARMFLILCTSSQIFVLTPKEAIPSSFRSSNFKVIRIAPFMSFSTNFSANCSSTPALSIHCATFSGDHLCRSVVSNSSLVNWKGPSRYGLALGVGKSMSMSKVIGSWNSASRFGTLGVIGDNESAFWKSRDSTVLIELRKRCGPLGPRTGLMGSGPISKRASDLCSGVRTSS